MDKLVLMSALLAGLSACGSNSAVQDYSSAIYCVNRSDLQNTENAPLARMCGENTGAGLNAAAPGAAGAILAPGQRTAVASPNSYVNNEAMYRAGNEAMLAVGGAR